MAATQYGMHCTENIYSHDERVTEEEREREIESERKKEKN